nr:formin-like protein 5 [Aegilops tauschii subsp. strangulata]
MEDTIHLLLPGRLGLHRGPVLVHSKRGWLSPLPSSLWRRRRRARLLPPLLRRPPSAPLWLRPPPLPPPRRPRSVLPAPPPPNRFWALDSEDSGSDSDAPPSPPHSVLVCGLPVVSAPGRCRKFAPGGCGRPASAVLEADGWRRVSRGRRRAPAPSPARGLLGPGGGGVVVPAPPSPPSPPVSSPACAPSGGSLLPSSSATVASSTLDLALVSVEGSVPGPRAHESPVGLVGPGDVPP